MTTNLQTTEFKIIPLGWLFLKDDWLGLLFFFFIIAFVEIILD